MIVTRIHSQINPSSLKECILLLPLPTTINQQFLNSEMRALVDSAQYQVISEYSIDTNNLSYFFSVQRLQEIKNQLEIDYNVSSLNLVIGSHISPKQGVNLENLFEIRIIDKFDLVLEIFADRAMTEESKLQIELAQLKYQRSRDRLRLMHRLGLEGAWHSERSGFWGPGENPLNVLDASITKKEAILRKKLLFLKRQREERRRVRKRIHKNSLYISLVGYTSAGKSTILNTLTDSFASSVDPRLFETLDTRIRSIQLDDLKIFITDSVGFIEDLPTFLIDSFKSTLEEALAADIIFMIIDGSEPVDYVVKKLKVTCDTLSELTLSNNRVLILNKTDLITQNELEHRLSKLNELYPEMLTIPISAVNDVTPLKNYINVIRPVKTYKCNYPANHSFRSFCYENARIESESCTHSDWEMIFGLRNPEYSIPNIKRKAKALGVPVELEVVKSVD
ncbi:MAG: GTPase HflX [Candidatus Heimdallarchaeota archaeon]|nr:GTPase HflX [Candidatus Heimdallarchaeota archaeon]